jgi:two-component system response regulator AtoC
MARIKKSTKLSNVLIIDDEAEYGEVIQAMLSGHYHTRFCNDAVSALELMGRHHFDFVLSDIQMPEMDGLQFLQQARQLGFAETGTTFIMMSAFGTQESALACIKSGAYDYISKPFKRDDILLTLAKAVEREGLRGRVNELEDELRYAYHFDNILARSDKMHDVFEVLRKVSHYKTTVLITGESGTGKELIAKALHHNSPRKNKSFVAVNCGAIPENLLESELFGYVKGAFTDASRDKEGLFLVATGGTIFLDEIGEMPPGLQVKLLRVLQENEVRPVGSLKPIPIDVRVVAATIRDLPADVQEKRFREDLFYRLNVIPIHVPPLRERSEDIPLLIHHFVKQFNLRNNTSLESFSPEAMRELASYKWPGNVRQLENVVERCSLLVDKAIIDAEDLPAKVRAQIDPTTYEMHGDNLSIKQAVRRIEEALIRKALKKTSGNRTRAAKLIEISHRALLYKIKDYGIDA